MQIRNPITELHDTKLYGHLLSLDQEYADRITTFVREVAPLMATIKDYFPYYTRHDAHHGYQVVSRMEHCLLTSCFNPTQPEALTAQEIFLLIAAAYAHDLGMTVFPGEEQALATKLGLHLESSWLTNESLQRYLRQNHSSRGGEYIDKNAEQLGVPRNLVAALDLLMKAHNYSIPQLEGELQRPFAAGQKGSNLAQLAVIVCVADAIEFSHTRVIDGVLERLGMDDSIAARISYAENMKHICTGDSLAVTHEGRIIVSGAFADANVLALAHRTLDQMEEWIQGYSDIDQRCQHRRLKVRGEPFQRDLVFSGGNFQRLGVRLNKRSVIDLIASNAIWRTHQGIALRELVQNAVEACRYRAHHSAPSDKYQPEVRVVFDREQHAVTVSDNGCGMSERTVLNNLLTVGSSRSREAAYTESDYAPIARFGIGFWSVFTISDVATVATAAFEDYRGRPSEAQHARGFEFDVQLSELKDFTVFAPVERPCGTTVKLKLKPEVIIDDVYTALKAQLLCSMVPLVLVLDGVEAPLGADVPDVNEEILFGVRRRAAEGLGIKVFPYRGATPRIDLAFGLAYRIENGRATFMAEPGCSMLSVIGGIRTQLSAVCGFSVPVRVTPLCIDLNRVGLYSANARTPQGFEFSIDRQQLNSNAAAQQYVADALQLFHEGYRDFLKETDSYRPESIHALQEEAASHGGNVYDVYTGTELATAKTSYPDLICAKLIPVNPNIPFSTAEGNSRFLDLNELSDTNGLIICLQATRAPMRYGSSIHLNLEDRGALEIAYALAQKSAQENPGEPVYLMQPDRTFSMLFDNSSSAKASVLSLRGQLDLCLLTVRLGEVNYEERPVDIVSNISGPWAGAIYWREFQTPDKKPYLFLGRHRVLINPGSPLQVHLKSLADEKRFAAIATVISLLKEDEAGHKPPSLANIL
ncbi:ATP-binding protein [Pseudomonas aeruginosa]|nr:ATP-binding protein [Pseudomonas aeruginosa]RMK89335.1 ATP-binding protein [Pseudomonas aeruginosa]RPZ93399.1 ATP-binding protein [Pseudomonas aeruginosa]RUH82259.1 ATP-binding protein [Pseudomonas aeruginosa]